MFIDVLLSRELSLVFFGDTARNSGGEVASVVERPTSYGMAGVYFIYIL